MELRSTLLSSPSLALFCRSSSSTLRVLSHRSAFDLRIFFRCTELGHSWSLALILSPENCRLNEFFTIFAPSLGDVFPFSRLNLEEEQHSSWSGNDSEIPLVQWWSIGEAMNTLGVWLFGPKKWELGVITLPVLFLRYLVEWHPSDGRVVSWSHSDRVCTWLPPIPTFRCNSSPPLYFRGITLVKQEGEFARM